MRRGHKIQKKRTHREIERERRGPTRRARGSRAQKVSRVRAQGDERNEHSLFPVPRQFYEYEIRGRSVGRTAAVHAARFAQSSQTRPSYWLCIRPPASSGTSLWTSPWMMLVHDVDVLARATRKDRLSSAGNHRLCTATALIIVLPLNDSETA